MSANGGLPLVTDVTFRISDAGDFFAIDFTCADGEIRGVALPSAALSRLVAGLLWTGAEAGRKGAVAPLDEEDAKRLRESAPQATALAVGRHGKTVGLGVQVGAAALAIRIDANTALDLAERLVQVFQKPGPLE